MAKIDVIVPIYNLEKYLDRCVTSLIAQTFKDIRIILIDDGSTDRSSVICDNWAEKYNNVVVIHKKNGGLSSARNAALDISFSDYIGFVDGDDYVDKEMFERLYANAIKYNADVSCCMMYDEKDEKKRARCSKTSGIINGKDDILRFVLNNGAHVCNKLFKREIFDDIRFSSQRTYEDVWIFLEWLEKVDSIYVDNKAFYHYVQRDSSITNRCFSRNKLNLIKSTKHNYKIILKKYPNVAGLALKNVMLACLDIAEDLYYAGKLNKRLLKYTKHYGNFIRKNIYGIIKEINQISLKELSRILIGAVSINVYICVKEMRKI